MKSILTVAAIVLSTFALQANAHQLPPLLTKCNVDFTVSKIQLVVGVGAGQAAVACEDGFGNHYAYNLKTNLITAGLTIGEFQTTGKIVAHGVGFTLAQLIKAVASVNIGPVLAQGQQAAVSLGANALGINADIAFYVDQVTGTGIDLADANLLLSF